MHEEEYFNVCFLHYHLFTYGCLQPYRPIRRYQHPPSEESLFFDIGGFGFFCNYLNFGEFTQYNAQGKQINQFNSYKYVPGLGWGFNFAQIGIKDLSFGLNIKYAHSALAPGIGEGSEGVGQTFAIDAGPLYRCPFGLRLGPTFTKPTE